MEARIQTGRLSPLPGAGKWGSGDATGSQTIGGACIDALSQPVAHFSDPVSSSRQKQKILNNFGESGFFVGHRRKREWIS